MSPPPRNFTNIPLPPVLSYTKGDDNQASFHLAPERPSDSRGGGVVVPLFDDNNENSKNLKPPATFGQLAHVNRITYNTRYSYIKGDLVFARNARSTGTLTHAHLKRKDRFERAKYAPIRHPDPRTCCNYDGAPLTALEERFRDIAVNYPDIKDGIMKAPFYFRTDKFMFTEEKQSEGFTRVFGTPEIRGLIVDHLMGGNEDLCNLFMACQFLARMLQSEWMHLDSKAGDFFNFDKHPLKNFQKQIQEARDGRDEAKVERIKWRMDSFSQRCIISPVRPQRQGPLQRQWVSQNGTPLNARVRESTETPWHASMATHYKLLHFVYNNGNALTDLILHAQPWLAVSAISRIIPYMPKLRTIGVHNCFLMNFGDTQALLGAINTLNESRKKLGQPHVAIDFTPFYYKGPGWKHDGINGHVTQGHFGEYGLVPEEWDWLYTEKAIGAQLFAIEDLCHKGGQDFFTPGKGFRSFLDRLPLRPYQLHSILDSIARIRDLKEKKHYSEISLLLPKDGSGVQTVNGADKPDISPEMLHAMQITVYSSFMVACNGVAMHKKDINNMLTLRGQFKLEHCYSCNMRMPACFFLENQLRRAANQVLCHGCQLGQALQAHAYRLNMQRRMAAEAMYRCKEHELDLVLILRRNSKSPNPEKPDWFPHQEWPPKGVKFSGRGSVHSVAWLRAWALWLKFTETLPKALDGERMNIQKLEEIIESEESFDISHATSYADKTPQCLKKDSEKEVRAIEFALGISQRNRCGGLSTEHRTCRSWEHAIKEYRTGVALDRDSGYTTHSMAIRSGKSGITSFSALLGHGGDLPYFALEAPVKEADYDQEDAWMQEYRDDHDDSVNALGLSNVTIADLIDATAPSAECPEQTTSSDLAHLTWPTGPGPATTPDVLPSPSSANEGTTTSPQRHDNDLPLQELSDETTSSGPVPPPRATSPVPTTTPEVPSGPSSASEATNTSLQRHTNNAPAPKRKRQGKKGRAGPRKGNNNNQSASHSQDGGSSSEKPTLSYSQAAQQRGDNNSGTSSNGHSSGKPKYNNQKPSNAPKAQNNTTSGKQQQRGNSVPPHNRGPKAKAAVSQAQETQKKPVWLPPHLKPSPQAKAKTSSPAQTEQQGSGNEWQSVPQRNKSHGKRPQRSRWVSRLTTSAAANEAES